MAEDLIQPTPRNGALGALADAVEWARGHANNATLVHPDSMLGRLFGGGGKLGDLLGMKGLGTELNNAAYGNYPLRMPPPGTGGYVPDFKRTLAVDEAGNRSGAVSPGGTLTPDNYTSSRAESLLDATGALQAAYPVAKAAGKAGALGALKMVNDAMMGQGKLAPALSAVSPRMAVRPRGGNFDESTLNFPETLGLTGAPGPTATWANKQLKNYITKDLGAPTDPLLAVEKEYPNLHLPEDAMFQGIPGQDLDYQLNPAQRVVHSELSGGVPLTPWGLHSGSAVEVSNVGRMRDMWNPDAVPEWMKKADPNTPMYALQQDGDELGFRHVLDYLDAAQAPYNDVKRWVDASNLAHDGKDPMDVMELYREMMGPHGDMLPLPTRDIQRYQALHNAGLTLTPEAVAKTSVADAVRKTAQWNEHLAKNGAQGSLDLARGIQSVHKEYPEAGMRWVKLGQSETPYTADTLPAGFELKPMGNRFAVENPVTRGDYYTGATPEEALEVFNKARSKEDLAAGLDAEGAAMGHCVGGYCDDVASRGTQIYSLRDAQNNPHVTVEVRGGKVQEHLDDYAGNGDRITWYQDNLPPRQARAFDAALEKRMDEGDIGLTSLDGWAHEWAQQNAPRAFQAYTKLSQKVPPDIYQIKGKQNAAPVAKYLPFVQDFVKSGQWGRVGDLENTGLSYIPSPQTLGPRQYTVPAGYHTPEEMRQHALGIDPNMGDAQIQDWVNRMSRKPGYAAGGSVNFAPKYSKKAALLARLQR